MRDEAVADGGGDGRRLEQADDGDRQQGGHGQQRQVPDGGGQAPGGVAGVGGEGPGGGGHGQVGHFNLRERSSVVSGAGRRWRCRPCPLKSNRRASFGVKW
ncbi:hypothetical protein AZA_36444 [Nitrospirillum viridazoti Y2]|nr:hypothetical protein AZA_36444 [Nitrospirillum amazonense Y2]